MCNICLLSPGSPNSERRCISEAFPDEVTIPMDTIGNNVTDNSNNNVRSSSANVNNTKTSHHSLRMIDHITKELVQFSQTSLNVDDSQAAISRNEQVPTLVTWDLGNLLPNGKSRKLRWFSNVEKWASHVSNFYATTATWYLSNLSILDHRSYHQINYSSSYILR